MAKKKPNKPKQERTPTEVDRQRSMMGRNRNMSAAANRSKDRHEQQRKGG